jgi:hypothetical protein
MPVPSTVSDSAQPPVRSRARRAAPAEPATGREPHRLRAEEPLALSARLAPDAAPIEADLVQLNLSYLHLARELARSARDLAITRLGLDAAACSVLCRLSVADLQALAHSRALIFGLRVAPGELPAQAQLARTNRAASDARVLLSAQR